jgi:hypothetical protein
MIYGESVVEGLDYAANRAKDGKRRVGLCSHCLSHGQACTTYLFHS